MTNRATSWEPVKRSDVEARLETVGVSPSNVVGPHRDGSYTLQFKGLDFWSEDLILLRLRDGFGPFARLTFEAVKPKGERLLCLRVTLSFPEGYTLPVN